VEGKRKCFALEGNICELVVFGGGGGEALFTMLSTLINKGVVTRVQWKFIGEESMKTDLHSYKNADKNHWGDETEE